MQTVVRYKGEYDAHGLYALMKGFFLDRDFDWYEQRIKATGSKIDHVWQAERKYNEYYQIVFRITYTQWQWQTLEKNTIDSTHKKKGRLQIKINVELKEHHTKIFYDTSVFQKFLKETLKVIRSREHGEHWEAVQATLMIEFANQVKAFLGMKG